jgi:hypothetical protein
MLPRDIQRQPLTGSVHNTVHNKRRCMTYRFRPRGDPMLTFDEAREIVAAHFGEPFARDGWEDDGAFLVTPQRVVDDERRGLVMAGGAWITVDRATGEIETWPHLDYLHRVQRMRRVRALSERSIRSDV